MTIARIAWQMSSVSYLGACKRGALPTIDRKIGRFASPPALSYTLCTYTSLLQSIWYQMGCDTEDAKIERIGYAATKYSISRWYISTLHMFQRCNTWDTKKSQIVTHKCKPKRKELHICCSIWCPISTSSVCAFIICFLRATAWDYEK